MIPKSDTDNPLSDPALNTSLTPESRSNRVLYLTRLPHFDRINDESPFDGISWPIIPPLVFRIPEIQWGLQMEWKMILEVGKTVNTSID